MASDVGVIIEHGDQLLPALQHLGDAGPGQLVGGEGLPESLDLVGQGVLEPLLVVAHVFLLLLLHLDSLAEQLHLDPERALFLEVVPNLVLHLLAQLVEDVGAELRGTGRRLGLAPPLGEERRGLVPLLLAELGLAEAVAGEGADAALHNLYVTIEA